MTEHRIMAQIQRYSIEFEVTCSKSSYAIFDRMKAEKEGF